MRGLSSLAVLLALGAQSDDGEAVVVISGDVTVPRGETVDGIYVASGDVRLAGHSDGDVVLFSGDAVVSGRIDGDLITFGGQARVLPRAVVSGDVRYGDERPLVAGEAIVSGDVSKESWPDSGDLVPFLGAFVLWLAIGISAAILGVLLLLIAPRAADALYERSRERVGRAIAIGFAIAIGLPVAGGLAAIVLVGLPLAIGIFLALLPLAAVAYVTSAWALGRRLVQPPRGRIVAFLAGLAILRLAALIPILGFLVTLAAAVFGLGLLGAAIWASREPREPVPARSPGS